MNIKSWFKRTEQKSFTTADHDYFDCAGGVRYIGNSSNPYNAKINVSYNNNFVYACTKKIEQYISSIPIHLYVWTNNEEKMITPHTVTTKRLKEIIKRETRIIGKSMDMVEVDEHPLISLLQYPAENMSYCDWIGIISNYLMLTGNALLAIVKEGNTIKYLNPLKWEFVDPFIIDGKIINYKYNDPVSKQETYLPEQVIHIRNFAPGCLVIGEGNLTACLDSARLFKYYDEYQLTLANNYAIPGVTVNVKNKIASEADAKSIADKFMQKFSGSNNGKPLVTFGDIDVKPLSFAPKDMEFAIARSWAKKTICATFGVPEDLVSTEDSNRASSITAINQFKSITIYPLLSKILDQLNSQLTTKYYDENSFVWFDPSETLDNDPAAQAQLLKTYIDAGIMTINEAREVLAMEPIESEGEITNAE